MSDGWRNCLLGDVVELKRGYDLPSRLREDGLVPVVSSGGISDTHIISKVKGPGVITGRYGTIGNVYFVNENYWPLNTTLYVKDFKGNHPRFIYYFLQLVDYYSCSDKAAVPGVNRNHLHLLNAKIPPLPEQKAIAHILGTLDDKIALNRQMNQTLEAMAQALFKSWFVDFDPVLDNALAAGNPIPHELEAMAEKRRVIANREARSGKQSHSDVIAQRTVIAPARRGGSPDEGAKQSVSKRLIDTNPALAALFPSSFVFDETLGKWIPEGWEVKTVGEISQKIFSGGTPNTQNPEFWNGEFHWFSSGETRNTFIISTEKYITQKGIDNSSTKLASKGDILIASAGQGNTRGQTSYSCIDTYVNQSVVIIRANQGMKQWLFFNLKDRYEEMRGLSDSHSIRGSLTTQILKGMKVIKPINKEIISFFDKLSIDSISKTIINRKETDTLTQLRDRLLPELISGRVRIKDTKF